MKAGQEVGGGADEQPFTTFLHSISLSFAKER